MSILPALWRPLSLLSLCLLLAPAISIRANAQSYTVQRIGTALSNNTYFGSGVNDTGQVTGFFVSDIYPYNAFLTGPNGALKAGQSSGVLNVTGMQNTSGYGVNDQGQVTGYSVATGDFHAVLWGPNGGALKDLGTVGKDAYSFGYAVNASGQVTGYSGSPNGPSHIFLSAPDGGALKDLGSLGGDQGIARAVNNSGQVTGYSTTASGEEHAFLSGADGGSLKDLGTLETADGKSTGTSYAMGINSSGQVTGSSSTYSGEHAFLTGPNGAGLQDLGTLSGSLHTTSVGEAVNDAGQVVGYSTFPFDPNNPFDTQHAFLFSDGSMKDLNSLIAPGLGFTLTNAISISNTGFILADGEDAFGNSATYLLQLNPVPEASTTVSFGLLLALGLGGMVIAAKRKKAA